MSHASQAIIATTTTLANAVELGQLIIEKLSGDTLVSGIAGETLRSQDVADLLTANIQKQLVGYLGESA